MEHVDVVADSGQQDIQALNHDEWASQLPAVGAAKPKMLLRNVYKYADKKTLEKLLKQHEVDKVLKVKKAPMTLTAIVHFEDEQSRDAGVAKMHGVTFKGMSLRAEVQVDQGVGEADDADDNGKSGSGKAGGGGGWANGGPGGKQEQQAPRSINEVVTPLYGKVTYENQLKDKQRNMKKQCYQKIIQATRKEWQQRRRVADTDALHESLAMPPWLDCKPGHLRFDAQTIRRSPVLEGYRNKTDMTVGLDAEGKPTVGFRLSSYTSGNTTVMYPEQCPNLPACMMGVVEKFQQFLQDSPLPVYDFKHHVGFWRVLTVRWGERTGQLMAILLVSFRELRERESMWEPERKRLIAALTDASDPAATPSEASVDQPRLVSLYLQDYQGASSPLPDEALTRLWGRDHIEEQLLGLRFRISPGAFFQTNTQGAEVLYNTVLENCQLGPDTRVVDVCCGTGTIGLCCAKKGGAKSLVGVDLCGSAIEDAKHNAELNGVEGTQFLCSRAEAVLESLLARLPLEGEGESRQAPKVCAIVDPPRDGLHNNVVRAIRLCAPIRRLVYVSCNPAKTLPRDAVLFCSPQSKRYRGVPFRVTRAIPVDMFPHTEHCEMVMVFDRMDEAEDSARDSTHDQANGTGPAALREAPDASEEAPGSREQSVGLQGSIAHMSEPTASDSQKRPHCESVAADADVSGGNAAFCAQHEIASLDGVVPLPVDGTSGVSKRRKADSGTDAHVQ